MLNYQHGSEGAPGFRGSLPLFFLAFCLTVGVPPASGVPESSALIGNKIDFELKYSAVVKDIPEGAKNIRIWIPYPRSDDFQRIYSIRVAASYPTYIHQEEVYGNEFLYLTIDNPVEKEIEIEMDILAARYEVINKIDFNRVGEMEEGMLPEADRYLKSNIDETADLAELKRIVDGVLKGKRRYIDKVKALYDYVYDNMDYSKEIAGYGKGDVGRACTVKSGNCIDFHSLFVALASVAGVPAREVANIEVPLEEGIPNYCEANYHCNVEVYLPNYGWIPLDISHARKGKRSKEFYFGSLDNLRLRIGQGRNIDLAPLQQGPPLTRLLHFPYVEVDGVPFSNVEVSALTKVYNREADKSYGVIIAAGEKARSFTGVDTEGRNIDLDDYLGKNVILLSFFTTWCGRCIWETEGLVKAFPEYNRKGVVFLRINVMEPEEKVAAFKSKHKIPFPVLVDEAGKISRLYGVKYVPANIIINRRGTVFFTGSLLPEEDLRRRLDEALKK